MTSEGGAAFSDRAELRLHSCTQAASTRQSITQALLPTCPVPPATPAATGWPCRQTPVHYRRPSRFTPATCAATFASSPCPQIDALQHMHAMRALPEPRLRVQLRQAGQSSRAKMHKRFLHKKPSHTAFRCSFSLTSPAPPAAPGWPGPSGRWTPCMAIRTRNTGQGKPRNPSGSPGGGAWMPITSTDPSP